MQANMRVHTHAHAYTHTHMYTDTHTHRHTLTHTHIRTHTYTHAHAHTHKHTRKLIFCINKRNKAYIMNFTVYKSLHNTLSTIAIFQKLAM